MEDQCVSRTVDIRNSRYSLLTSDNNRITISSIEAYKES